MGLELLEKSVAHKSLLAKTALEFFSKHTVFKPLPGYTEENETFFHANFSELRAQNILKS